MEQTRFTPDTVRVAQADVMSTLNEFPGGPGSHTPVPGCNIGVGALGDWRLLSVAGYVDPAAAEKFEQTNAYFTFTLNGRGKMVFCCVIQFEEDVPTMKLAVYDLVYQQLRVFMEE